MKLHVLQISACIIIIAAVMKMAAPVVNLILLALLLAMSLMPVILWLMKKGVPKAVSLGFFTFFIQFYPQYRICPQCHTAGLSGSGGIRYDRSTGDRDWIYCHQCPY
jgi:hypothetical protein